MTVKRLNLRLNLDREEDRKAWENLERKRGSISRIIVAAVNAYFEPDTSVDIICRTIRECFQDATPPPKAQKADSPAISEDDAALLEAMDAFLGT